MTDIRWDEHEQVFLDTALQKDEGCLNIQFTDVHLWVESTDKPFFYSPRSEIKTYFQAGRWAPLRLRKKNILIGHNNFQFNVTSLLILNSTTAVKCVTFIKNCVSVSSKTNTNKLNGTVIDMNGAVFWYWHYLRPGMIVLRTPNLQKYNSWFSSNLIFTYV